MFQMLFNLLSMAVVRSIDFAGMPIRIPYILQFWECNIYPVFYFSCILQSYSDGEKKSPGEMQYICGEKMKVNIQRRSDFSSFSLQWSRLFTDLSFHFRTLCLLFLNQSYIRLSSRFLDKLPSPLLYVGISLIVSLLTDTLL